ncbi:lipocalin family protein [Flavobacterium sp.]|uniref:lipocalin family protein n=1 Tax=Flavobacterium sp. TaxID=239 RepID=UPI0024878B12|nr:lipocalin family protein [Flavobacterium sp.]MDI1315894.1 lipocalin family protein [Flavobacterium sp.]
MKKVILIAVLSVFVLGCKSKSATNTRLDSKTQVAMKGNWTISAVTYPSSDVIKVTSFDLADSKCFIGSSWKFISNNNKGSLVLNNASCTAYSTPITWFINKEGQFVLKVLDETKAKKIKEGYVLGVSNLTENSFQLVDKINIGGKVTDVVYQFQRQ